jgi:hypothetical protein
LIDGHRELLRRFAGELLAKEVLERADIDRLMDGVPRIGGARPLGDVRLAASTPHAAPPQ